MASKLRRIGARLLDLCILVVPVIVVLALFGDEDRPFAAAALVWAVLTSYETVTVVLFGTTVGKRAAGLRVIALDEVGGVPAHDAAKRAAVNAALSVLPLVGWAVALTSTVTDPLGRGVADRAARTMVVPRSFAALSARDLPGYADGVRPPRLIVLGRVGDLDVRARARLRRLNDSPVLVAAIGLLALAASLPYSTATIVIASSIAWVAVFIVDETMRVHRDGTTAGHRAAGLLIRSRRTGLPPSVGRSFLRALVLGLTLYVPIMWPLLVVSLLMIRFNESAAGLHDIAGGTVVLADPSLDPEEQRQRAMRMRIGQAV